MTIITPTNPSSLEESPYNRSPGKTFSENGTNTDITGKLHLEVLFESQPTFRSNSLNRITKVGEFPFSEESTTPSPLPDNEFEIMLNYFMEQEQNKSEPTQKNSAFSLKIIATKIIEQLRRSSGMGFSHFVKYIS